MRPGKLDATTVYRLFTALFGLTYSLVLTVSLIYQTQEAGLTPFQLVIAGAAMQISTFVFEIPTGVVADVRGRRLSVLTGLALMGSAFLLMGANTTFAAILVAQIIAGLGITFISGAQEAWIADEVGPLRAGQVYMQGAQALQVARLLGIPLGVAIGVVSLQLSLLTGGAMFLLTSLFLLAVMPETGFRPAKRNGGGPLVAFTTTFSDGIRLVRARPVLVTLFAMVGFYEVGGEVFIRLNVAHFLDIGLPGVKHLEPVVWFGGIRMVASLAGLVLVGRLRAGIDANSHEDLGRWLTRINLLQALAMLSFAVSGSFWMAALAYIIATSLSRTFQPLHLALINLHAESSVRATVISMSRQTDALAQAIGAPALGAVASLLSVRAALAGASSMLLPAIGLNILAQGQNRKARVASAPAAD
ncbi:MAG TPA: MFS transporter [Dehalococcoidia bacterium]|nr:MFS transporter [Dehalococcoidia bacterium]